MQEVDEREASGVKDRWSLGRVMNSEGLEDVWVRRKGKSRDESAKRSQL